MPAPRGNRYAVEGKGKPPLQRFIEKCAFDAATGCVMWVGGTTSGHGHHEPYGSFWFEGSRWFAHRWAAIHIHGYDITGLQVDHNCPCGPSTLCVQHLKPETGAVNRTLQNTRPGRAFQNLDTQQHWLFVSKGIARYERRTREIPDIPYYDPPEWLKPFLPVLETVDDCPF
jgi:hypothetical protein